MSFIQAKPIATYDLYGPVHKGLRQAIGDVLTRIGRTDPADPCAVSATLFVVREQCRISAKHLLHEEVHIHPALAARASGAAEPLDTAHAHHQAAFTEIEGLAGRIEMAGQSERANLWRQLYLRFSHFVADDLAHMAEEEMVAQPLLQSLYSDAELAALEQRILASIPQDDMMVFLRMMVAAGSFADRVALLSGVQASAPPQAFAAILDVAVKSQVAATEWTDLARALSVAA